MTGLPPLEKIHQNSEWKVAKLTGLAVEIDAELEAGRLSALQVESTRFRLELFSILENRLEALPNISLI
jgi:hypothetical protein